VTEIMASDLNQRSISHARTGIYGEYSTRNLDAHFRDKYFRALGDKLQLNQEVQAKVIFSRINLLDTLACCSHRASTSSSAAMC
jgi:chemotaxis methyl-accepting protein methylase